MCKYSIHLYTKVYILIFQISEFKGNAFAGIFLMRTPQLLAIEPEFIKNVMITNFKNFHENDFFDVVDKETDPIFGRNPFFLQGEEWKEKRAEITPAFTPSRVSMFLSENTPNKNSFPDKSVASFD